MQEPIKRITMGEYKTDRFSVYLDAYIYGDGDLYLNAEQIGMVPGYEFQDFLRVNKDHKEAVLLGLVKEQCKNVAGATKWMDVKGIRRQPGRPWRLKSLLEANKEYKDTILLLLLKERFPTMDDFMDWLKAKGIPWQFHSES